MKMFTPITGERLESFRRNTNRRDLEMEIAPLSFYEHGNLVRISDKDEVHFFVVAGDDWQQATWFMLDGTSDPIHAANKVSRLRIKEDTVLDYLQFFCDFLLMDEGRMQIVGECILHCEDGKIIPTEAAKLLGKAGESYLCKAHLVYNREVYEADFAVPPDGCTKMLSDCPLEAVTVH